MSCYDVFLQAYLGAVLDHELDEDEHFLRDRFTVHDFSDCTRARAFTECRDFLDANVDLIDINVELAGRLFWSTRNPGRGIEFSHHIHAFGHEGASNLQRAAKACGSRTVTVEGGELFIQ